MKATVITAAALAALYSLFSPAAYADCGKTNSRQALLPLAANRVSGLHSESDESVRINRPDADASQHAAPQLVIGLWLTTGTIDGQQTQAFEAFTSDGLEVLNDNGSPIEGNVCLGVWQAGPGGVVSVNHPSWYYDPSGNLIGTATIKEQITVDAGGKTFHGTITVDVYDLNGVLQVHLAGTYTGKRITA